MRLRLEFPSGLPAFEDQHKFSLDAHPRQAPLHELRSESTPLFFYLLPIHAIDPAYEIDLSAADRTQLRLEETASLLAFAILTTGENSPPTANLLAPVVVNPSNGRAVQAVRADARYSHQHPLGPVMSCL
jgi:flagellar assembly factor FliW